MVIENKNGEPIGKEDCVPSLGNSMWFPLMMAMFATPSERQQGALPSRKHSFQQFILSLFQRCESKDEADAIIDDMQEAVTSSRKVIESMVW